MRLLHVLTKTPAYFDTIFQQSENYRVTQSYREQDNDCVHNSQIYNGNVKTVALKFITQFLDATVNKRICLLNFGFNKNDKHVHVLSFVQLWLYIENEPKVVIFIARWAVSC